MLSYGEEVVISERLRDRLSRLVALARENPRQAARVVARRVICFLRSFAPYVTNIIFPPKMPTLPSDQCDAFSAFRGQIDKQGERRSSASGAQDIIDLKSPLIECGEGDLLPGAVSLQDRQLCNDATILAQSPLSVIMPQQQWSYGILLPINHAKLASAGERVVIQLKLVVRDGQIGVAGIDASLKTLTTLEHFVGSGRRQLR